MPAFQTLDELRGSLRKALGRGRDPSRIDAVVATARPTVFFIRRQEIDDPLPVGTSKIGGVPDLPANFVWPVRDAYPDAEAREASFLAVGEQVRAMMADSMDEAELDEMRAEIRGKSAFFHHPFPLIFAAQLNLADLASGVGFAPELPRSGLLSIFQDLMDEHDGAPRLFWHDVPIGSLARRQMPQSLVDYYETYCQSMGDCEDETYWRDLTMAEVLHPVSGFGVPDHWRATFADGDALAEWMDEAEDQLDFAAHASQFGGECCAFFGDSLGGWPSNIQGDPESEIDDVEIDEPGHTPWRHIFSFGGEYWSGSRLVPLENASDGNTFIFLHEADLRSRRFERARAVHQMT